MNFLILHDPRKPKASILANTIRQSLKRRGIKAQMHKGAIESNTSYEDDVLALILGGDGFIVKNALQLAKMEIPLMGINFGTVGFLAPVEPEDWKKAIEKILNGRYQIKRNKLLEGVFRSKDGRTKEFEAVNEIAFLLGLENFIRVKVEMDNGFNVYGKHEDVGGDGMMVVAATGSTAYNLSVGGPIFEIGLCITPVGIHRADVKPILLAENRRVRIICLGQEKNPPEEFSLKVDGHSIYGESKRTIVVPGDEVSVQYSETAIQFIEPEGHSFIGALQNKLGLSR